MTPTEVALWSRLRALKAQGWHFRRQSPEGPFIPDFVCRSAKLVVEVDGAHHSEAHHAAHDEQRDQFLQSRGYRVLRFWASDIEKEPEGVVDTILQALAGAAPGLTRERTAPRVVSRRHTHLTRMGLRQRDPD